MSEKTGIAWTDATWNPGVFGCKEVSPGCANCYAAVQAERLGSALGQKNYAGLTKADARGGRVWTGEVRVLSTRQQLEKPIHWREPRMIFVNSMSDLFNKAVPDHHIESVLDVMAQTPRHTYQTLTKRPERMLAFLADRPTLPNAWWGTSIEDQARAVERLPIIRQVKAAVRFVSFEPLIGPIQADLTGIEWAIVGGESGPHRRPFNEEWAATIYRQCQTDGVAYFGKQTSALRSGVELPEPLNEKHFPAARTYLDGGRQ